jgi:hypothetical protein
MYFHLELKVTEEVAFLYNNVWLYIMTAPVTPVKKKRSKVIPVLN